MAKQALAWRAVYFSCFVLLACCGSDVPSPHNQEQVSTTHSDVLENSKKNSTTNTSTEHSVIKSPILRSRRNTNLDNKNIFNQEGNRALRSVFKYNDQIMRNLLQNHSPKSLNYARSNFFLNLLKPLDRRTTRYSNWDDHSVMHFGKRSVDAEEAPPVIDKEVKLPEKSESPITTPELSEESTDFDKRSYPWSDHNVMHFGKRSEDDSSPENINSEEKSNNNADDEETWNNIQDIDKKSENHWSDHNTMHFGKRPDDPWHSMMSFGKRGENPFDDHNTMHFGKRDDDPWHSMMSFGKRDDDPWHSMMSFGKRGEHPFDDHNTMHFGKRDDPWHSMMSFGKRGEYPFDDHNTMHFGKRPDDPWHSMMSFGKRGENPFGDHNTMHFGKRDDDPWHSMMSFGKRGENPFGDHNTMHFGKKNDDPWHSMMSFGKRGGSPFGDHSTMHFGKRDDDPWHSMMSFGKRGENPFGDHNTMHFGKRGESPFDDHNTMHFGKREDDPWHSMMSFGKRGESPFNDHSTMHFGKREDDPWHSMMSFGKRGENPFGDHSTMHFGKRDDEPWHSMMSFGKKSENPFNDHSTMHFGKRDDDPWHSMMSFGKKSEDSWENHNTLHFGKKSDDEQNMMNSEKRPENSVNDQNKASDAKHIKKRSVHSSEFNGADSGTHDGEKNKNLKSKPGTHAKQLKKRNDPWDNHNTLHFGKKSMWWMSPDFGKKFDPWNTHNTMHFGKKANYWDTHNTMHFGKRSKLKDSQNAASSYKSSKEKDKTDKTSNIFEYNMDDFNGMLDDKITEDSYKSYENEGGALVAKNKDTSLISPGHISTSKIEGTEKVLEKRSTDEMQKRSLKGMHSKEMPARIFKVINPQDLRKLEKSTPITNEMNDVKTAKTKAANNTLAVNGTKDKDGKELHVAKRSIEQMPMEMSEDKQNGGQLSSQNHESENSEEDPSTDIILRIAEIPDEFQLDEMRKLDNAIDKQDSLQVGSKYEHFWNTLSRMNNNKKFDPWSSHNTMHFGKRFDPLELHNTMHFGKKNDPWNSHNTMHFGKKSDPWESHNTLHFGKRADPWESHNTLHFGKKADPWESHNTLHFGKRTDPWDLHNTMHFGKKADPWESHNTLHFGKKSDPWESHNTLHFGKKSNPWEAHNTLHFGKKFDPWDSHNTMHFGKRSDLWESHNTMHFGKRSDSWDSHNTMHFGKKSDPWENHNTLHFGKKSDPWELHNTMHFGKKSDPWELHNTMHFGKKSDPWDNHNTLHFGKKSDPWESHNTLHFGKRDEAGSDMLVWIPENENEIAYNSESPNSKQQPLDSENKYLSLNDKRSNLDNSEIFGNFKNILSSEENPGIIFDGIQETEFPLSDLTPLFQLENHNGLGKNDMFFLKNLQARLSGDINANDFLRMLDKIQQNSELPDGDGLYLLESPGNGFSNNNLKIKQKLLKNPDTKRYWAAPFQGPKSIVYPHAWLASQIRRSVIPKSIDYPRIHETRTAEKKEDPVNSFMHFGRR
ncbi:uncharacterized protein LOC129964253 [Argiope bruennichi]|uniref:uncharacterized protein LOC129964253 n=1 Tax=Argiope bruennichi TaxID=94029 RepID=UPI0024950AFC|nr:uncharacterized protein LOC129964253 [Argiope bruennichi]